ncbi:MAG: Polyketide cyclase / dehydrase and lipid transport, partial [candidate division NC10 bacterium]|nr:Polyketide cyclase / dehydrase and lipid transport [candidate division NC10 bacterium]
MKQESLSGSFTDRITLRSGSINNDGSVDFQVTVDIEASPEIVWGVMSDAERWHEWTPSVR